jgi:hypothetical protein
LTLNETGSLLSQIGSAAIANPPNGWSEVTVTITGMGPMTQAEAIATIGDVKEFVSLDFDSISAAKKLRRAMYVEHTGTWYRAVLTITPEGEIATDFDYNAKPYDLEDEGTEPIIDLLLDDHERYPRDLKHLPDWHPAKHMEL